MEEQREESFKHAAKYLKTKGATEIRCLSLEYPYAIYDIEYKLIYTYFDVFALLTTVFAMLLDIF